MPTQPAYLRLTLAIALDTTTLISYSERETGRVPYPDRAVVTVFLDQSGDSISWC